MLHLSERYIGLQWVERPADNSFWRYDRNILFFFQAEDGIRDKLVTGVQTCALPIYLRLASAATAARREPARESGQIEHLHLERRGPEVAIVGAEHEPMEPSRLVVRSRHHGGGAGGRSPRDPRLRGAGRRCHRQGEPQPEPPRWVHWSHSANASTPPPERST